MVMAPTQTDDEKSRAVGALTRGRYDWNDLRTFYIVGSSGSFNRAAVSLNCKQQTVSSTIARLEAALGAKLFNRSNTGATLTQTGREVFDRAKTMYRINTEIEDNFGDHDVRDSGVVQLRCTEGLASIVIAPELAKFYGGNPDIDLVVRNSDQPLDVATEPDDIGIQYDRGAPMDAVAVSLGFMHFMLFATRDYLNTYGTPRDAIDVLKFRVLTAATHNHQRESWKPRPRAMDEFVREVTRYGLVADSSLMMLTAFLNGAGLAMLPTFAINQAALGGVPEEELVLLDFGVEQKIEFWMVFHRDRGEITRVRKVINFLKEVHDRPCFRPELVHPREFSNVQVLKSRR